MSDQHHSSEWHDGYATGRQRALEETVGWAEDLAHNWYEMKHVDDRQMVALQYFLRALERKNTPPTPTVRSPIR